MNALTGTGTLVRLALRLDRVRLSVWVLLLAVTAGGDRGPVPEAVPDRSSRCGRSAASSPTRRWSH